MSHISESREFNFDGLLRRSYTVDYESLLMRTFENERLDEDEEEDTILRSDDKFLKRNDPLLRVLFIILLSLLIERFND